MSEMVDWEKRGSAHTCLQQTFTLQAAFEGAELFVEGLDIEREGMEIEHNDEMEALLRVFVRSRFTACVVYLGSANSSLGAAPTPSNLTQQ